MAPHIIRRPNADPTQKNRTAATRGLVQAPYRDVGGTERHREVHGGDGKWHAQSPDKMHAIYTIIAATENVIGIERANTDAYGDTFTL